MSTHTHTTTTATHTCPQSNFEDHLPLMAEKLGGEGLIGELCKGFQLLMDEQRGVITFESLKRNAAVLGLGDLGDDELRSMMREGDFDGDGALSQMEFCVLMFRLSPELMDQSEFLLDEALMMHDDEEYEEFTEESDEVKRGDVNVNVNGNDCDGDVSMMDLRF